MTVNTKEYKGPFLKTEGLSVHYGRAIALASIDINVDKGEIVAVLGPNGTGKTTLMRALSGLVELERGQVFFEGNKILESTKSEFRKIGGNKSLKSYKIVELGIIHCPERRRLFSDSTVEENLRLGAYTIKNKEEVEKNLDLVLSLFPELKDRLNDKAGKFSGGQQQMVAIGRALMGSPKLLMLDEPSLGLAPIIKQKIINVIQEIRKTGTTILLVEQDVSMALNVCDRAYILENARIEIQGSRDEILNNDYVKTAYLGI
ncbi:MAG: ABC transporter ATP-binding protein [Candidatus Hodarchaeales archaeon]|jgi:branched-chain amino acid transport system ATP-binding protein